MILHETMKELNKIQPSLAAEDKRGLKKYFYEWRREAIFNPWGYLIVSEIIAFLIALVLWLYFIFIYSPTSAKQFQILFLLSNFLTFPFGIAFWYFLTDTTFFSFDDRVNRLKKAFLEKVSKDKKTTIDYLKEGIDYTNRESNSFLHIVIIASVTLFLNILSSKDFQHAMSEKSFVAIWNENILGATLLCILPIMYIVYFLRYGFHKFWLSRVVNSLILDTDEIANKAVERNSECC